MNRPRNFVAKHAAEFCKPKVFRDRKKEVKGDTELRPRHKPYHRVRDLTELEELEWDEEEYGDDP